MQRAFQWPLIQQQEQRSHLSQSLVLGYNLYPQFREPIIPTISCDIGNHKIERALLDLDSSVNLISYSVYLELGLGELKPSNYTLHLIIGQQGLLGGGQMMSQFKLITDSFLFTLLCWTWTLVMLLSKSLLFQDVPAQSQIMLPLTIGWA